jgi:Stage II sporulation protein E (SpoIIE)
LQLQATHRQCSSPAADCACSIIDFTSGDRLVLYTDGLVEVFNQNDEMFRVQRLEGLVRESAKRAMGQAILDAVAAWRHGPPPTMCPSLSSSFGSFPASGAGRWRPHCSRARKLHLFSSFAEIADRFQVSFPSTKNINM